MTAEELLRRGHASWEAGDLEGAEAAYRAADELGDAEGGMYLGVVLKQRGNLVGAVDAFQRAEARGHAEAACSLGNLLWDKGEVAGAKEAFKRSIAAGSANAVLNLGLLLAEAGAGDEALPYLRSAEDKNLPGAARVVGKILEERDDRIGAEAAYLRGAEAGDANAAYSLGVLLYKSEDIEGARAAFESARSLGHEGAGQVLQVLEQQVGPAPVATNQDADTSGAAADPAIEEAANWAQLYIAACKAVLAAATSCIEVANKAVGARNAAARRPQHEISIQTFTRMAEAEEQDFSPLYRAFTQVCAEARDTAARFLASQTAYDPEIVLIRCADEDTLGDVATVKAILHASYGYTTAGFIEGVAETNAFLQDPSSSGGLIYTPPTPVQSEERLCPWCAETTKAAAVVCRFCGREPRALPGNTP